ncbi:hypothetical protein NPIL_93931 [Nephila pilipes]|uniref:Uncharacterized protein n=1 Tax=Nephila pilipes TaxID=299642 RepID=A0A8X6P303_NEPPI|nr:hypothetical protein NPIL_93931 [Nephila pilipes]
MSHTHLPPWSLLVPQPCTWCMLFCRIHLYPEIFLRCGTDLRKLRHAAIIGRRAFVLACAWSLIKNRRLSSLVGWKFVNRDDGDGNVIPSFYCNVRTFYDNGVYKAGVVWNWGFDADCCFSSSIKCAVNSIGDIIRYTQSIS